MKDIEKYQNKLDQATTAVKIEGGDSSSNDKGMEVDDGAIRREEDNILVSGYVDSVQELNGNLSQVKNNPIDRSLFFCTNNPSIPFTYLHRLSEYINLWNRFQLDGNGLREHEHVDERRISVRASFYGQFYFIHTESI